MQLKILIQSHVSPPCPSANHVVLFTIEKNPHISEPRQFKSMLLKGQLYAKL